MNNRLARLMRKFGRRPNPPRPPKPTVTLAEMIAVKSAFARETGGILRVNHPHADFVPVETRFVAKPRGTIFAFSGLTGVMGMTPKNLAKMFKNSRRDLVIIKDVHQDWYQSGLAGVAKSRAEMTDFLYDNFGGCPRPWLFIGSCEGGFAAMHFGLNLQANKIIVYSPQSHVTGACFEFYRHETPNAAGFDADDPENDILQHPELGHPATEVTVYYSDLSQMDYDEAARLFGTSNTKFHPVETTWHNSALVLKKAGKLMATLK